LSYWAILEIQSYKLY